MKAFGIEEIKRFFSNELDNMNKMAAMPLHDKNALKSFYSGTYKPTDIELGMLHSGFMLVTMYSNNDSGLILTYFTPFEARCKSLDERVPTNPADFIYPIHTLSTSLNLKAFG